MKTDFAIKQKPKMAIEIETPKLRNGDPKMQIRYGGRLFAGVYGLTIALPDKEEAYVCHRGETLEEKILKENLGQEGSKVLVSQHCFEEMVKITNKHKISNFELVLKADNDDPYNISFEPTGYKKGILSCSYPIPNYMCNIVLVEIKGRCTGVINTIA